MHLQLFLVKSNFLLPNILKTTMHFCLTIEAINHLCAIIRNITTPSDSLLCDHPWVTPISILRKMLRASSFPISAHMQQTPLDCDPLYSRSAAKDRKSSSITLTRKPELKRTWKDMMGWEHLKRCWAQIICKTLSQSHTSASLNGAEFLVFKLFKLIFRFQPALAINGICGDWEGRTKKSTCDQVSGERSVSSISVYMWSDLQCVVWSYLLQEVQTMSKGRLCPLSAVSKWIYSGLRVDLHDLGTL